MPYRSPVLDAGPTYPWWLRYGLVVPLVAVALGVRLLLSPLIGNEEPLLLLTIPIFLAGYFGGIGPGSLATLLGAIGGMYLLNSRGPHPLSVDPEGELALSLFVIVGLTITWISDGLRRSRRRARVVAAAHEAAEALLERMFEASGDCVQLLDSQGRLQWINPSGLEMLEIEDLEAHRGRAWVEAWPDDDRAEAQDSLKEAMAGGAGAFIGAGPTAKGTLKVWDVVVSPVMSRDGKVQRLLSVSRDVTEQHRVEEATRKAEAQLRLITDSAPLLISFIDRNLRYRFVNQRYADWFSRSRSEIIGRSVQEVIGPEAFEAALPHIEDALRGNQVRYEQETTYKDGTSRFVHTDIVPDVDEEGSVRGFVSVVSNITDRRRAEEALQQAYDSLRESEERFRLMVTNSPDLIIYHDLDLKYAWVSRLQEGQTMEQFVGSDEFAFLDRPQAERIRAIKHSVLAEGKPRRYETSMEIGGQMHYYETALELRRGQDGQIIGLTSYVRDITERRQMEQERTDLLRREHAARLEAESAQRLSALFAEAGEVLNSSLDYETTFEQLAWLVVPYLGGWCAIDVATERQEGPDGRPFRRVAIAHTDPKKVELARKVFERYPPKLDDPGGVARVLREGAPEIYPVITDDMLTGGVQDPEHLRILRELGLHSAIIVPLTVHGHVLGALTVVSDTPGRHYDDHDLFVAQELARRAAVAVYNARLYRQAQLASQAKDEFLAALSHELRNPLNPVLLTLSACRDYDDVPPTLRDDLEMIRRNVELEARLIDDLLDLTRISRGKLELQMQPLDMRNLVDEVVALCTGGAHPHAPNIEVQHDAEMSHVVGDPVRLRQVLWNLLSNALKFTAGDGSIRVTTTSCPGISDTHWLDIQVADTGIGIEPEALVHIFDAFEQADREVTRRYGGLGLGLAISRKLVEMHGGTIAAASEGRNRGATFTIRLPLSPAPLPPKDDHSGPIHRDAPAQMNHTAGAEQTGLRILLVEDHVSTARVMTRLLKRLGHEVICAGSVTEGREALSREAASGRGIDLLLSDLGLPDGSGLDLIGHVSKTCSIPSIAISGFGMEHDRQASLKAGFQMHLTKPIDFKALREAIERLIGGDSAPGAGEASEQNWSSTPNQDIVPQGVR